MSFVFLCLQLFRREGRKSGGRWKSIWRCYVNTFPCTAPGEKAWRGIVDGWNSWNGYFFFVCISSLPHKPNSMKFSILLCALSLPTPSNNMQTKTSAGRRRRAADGTERMRHVPLEGCAVVMDCILRAPALLCIDPTSDYVLLYYEFITSRKPGRKSE